MLDGVGAHDIARKRVDRLRILTSDRRYEIWVISTVDEMRGLTQLAENSLIASSSYVSYLRYFSISVLPSRWPAQKVAVSYSRETWRVKRIFERARVW